jgi:ssDNA-binding Zn-finger/Zn-ribbon topoisomerase 1
MEPPREKEVIMATCKKCGTDTQLYANDVPICIACLDALEAKAKPAPKEEQAFRATAPPSESRQ